MKLPPIPELIAQLEACQEKDWRLDDAVNNTIGQVRKVHVIGLNGTGAQRRYFGPKARSPRGTAVPSPTRSTVTRRRAIATLKRILKDQS